jgi:translation initiation factor IF-2
VIVQEGTLKVGDYLVCGMYYCKVKSIIDDHGKQIKSAATSSPVSVTGWSGIPEVGTNFVSAKDEKSAKELSESNELAFKREHDKLVDQNSPKISNVDQLFSAIVATKEKVLNVILRSDVHGSAEALNDFLSTIKSDKIKLNILDCGVGAIGKNDVTFANTSNAEIVAFNVKVEAGAQALAKQLGVKIIQHNIIYEIIEKVREAMAECLDPELRENKFGGAEVRQVFNIKNSVIAGCMVTEGKIVRDKFLRVIRNGEIIFQGKFASIRRLKEDVGEVRAGFECGIVASGFNSFSEGDTIECFEIQKIQPSL